MHAFELMKEPFTKEFLDWCKKEEWLPINHPNCKCVFVHGGFQGLGTDKNKMVVMKSRGMGMSTAVALAANFKTDKIEKVLEPQYRRISL